MLLDNADQLIVVYIACRSDDHITSCIMPLQIVDQMVTFQGLNSGSIAQHTAAQWMTTQNRISKQIVNEFIRGIFIHLDFLDDDFLFLFDLTFVKRGMK